MRTDPLYVKGTAETVLANIMKALFNRLTIEENMWAKQLTVTSHATPGTAFTVTHALGKVPTTWIAMPQSSCKIWEHDRANWTISTMQLKCDASSATIVLTVL